MYLHVWYYINRTDYCYTYIQDTQRGQLLRYYRVRWSSEPGPGDCQPAIILYINILSSYGLTQPLFITPGPWRFPKNKFNLTIYYNNTWWDLLFHYKYIPTLYYVYIICMQYTCYIRIIHGIAYNTWAQGANLIWSYTSYI